MDFEERLQKAIHRGRLQGDERAREESERALSEDDLKRLHTGYRLQLSDQIEGCLAQLPGHFPGFDFQTIFGDRGWGGAASTHYWASPKDKLVIVTMEQVMPYTFATEWAVKKLIYDAIEE